ncbi:hypothetical protein LXL04_019459 [Taraxacum kok-saghyz]
MGTSVPDLKNLNPNFSGIDCGPHFSFCDLVKSEPANSGNPFPKVELIDPTPYESTVYTDEFMLLTPPLIVQFDPTPLCDFFYLLVTDYFKSEYIGRNESVDLSNHQPKKRRKDSEKVSENITDLGSNSGLLINKSEELNQSLPVKEKDMNREQLKANVSGTTQQAMVRKEGSNTKSKSALLKKAIKDLDKIVVLLIFCQEHIIAIGTCLGSD